MIKRLIASLPRESQLSSTIIFGLMNFLALLQREDYATVPLWVYAIALMFWWVIAYCLNLYEYKPEGNKNND